MSQKYSVNDMPSFASGETCVQCDQTDGTYVTHGKDAVYSICVRELKENRPRKKHGPKSKVVLLKGTKALG